VSRTNANSAGGDGGARQAFLEPSKSASHNSLPSPAAQGAALKRHDAMRSRCSTCCASNFRSASFITRPASDPCLDRALACLEAWGLLRGRAS
jgi:hypothetical protein